MHAVASTPEGPYSTPDVVWPVWAHNPTVTRVFFDLGLILTGLLRNRGAACPAVRRGAHARQFFFLLLLLFLFFSFFLFLFVISRLHLGHCSLAMMLISMSRARCHDHVSLDQAPDGQWVMVFVMNRTLPASATEVRAFSRVFPAFFPFLFPNYCS